MDESTKSKRNRAERKNKKQQKNESENSNVADRDDNVFDEESQSEQVYLLLCAISIA
jgi:hypothetical protein